MTAVFLLRRNRPALLASLKALYGDEAAATGQSWRCAGTATLWRDALPQLQDRAPDVLVCDLQLLDGPVSQLLQRMAPRQARVLLIAPTTDDPLLFPTLRCGAEGYHLESAPGCSQGLMAALAALQAQHASVSPALARQLLQAFGLPSSGLQLAHCVAAAHDDTPVAPGLVRAQQHLLSLVSHGLLAAEIAQRWQLAEQEIARRIGRILAALHQLQPWPQPVLNGASVC
jgi:DNA-binding NarL/FixJ family response regulator